ncbi:pollen-specific leucine-rich repeat extensin-like protein 2 [Limulus polyphemus]|uniref:Pollen-specific leucine-rich repeat extensin-like protein 2 n=1 Tax=Limulus polyphemus TaxID=6850 RepID=A0ABM1T4S8_LIMPO|nr:pollen-specific leucine-rich repeat extensin-like protein 2 [Limulus polyphemus]
MKTPWVLIGLFLGSLVVVKADERDDAVETLIQSASNSGILSTFAPDSTSSGYVLAYPLDETSENTREQDQYMTAESLEGTSIVVEPPKLQVNEETKQDDDDDDKTDEALLLIIPEEETEQEERTEKDDEEEGTEKDDEEERTEEDEEEEEEIEEDVTNTDDTVEEEKTLIGILPQPFEETETPEQAIIPENRRPKEEDLRKILGLESPFHPFLRKPKPIPEDKPRPFRFPPAYSKSSFKQERLSVPFPLKPESRSDLQFLPFPLSQMAESILIRRALIIGNDIDEEVEGQSSNEKDEILVVESDKETEEEKNPPEEPQVRPFSPVHLGPIRRPDNRIKPSMAFLPPQFQPRSIRRPDVNIQPNLVFSRSQKHPIHVNSGFSVKPPSPIDPPASLYQDQIHTSVPYAQSYYGPPALPPLHPTLLLLGYPQHSPLAYRDPRLQPLYNPQTETYPSPPTLYGVHPFYQQHLRYRSPVASPLPYSQPPVAPIFFPDMMAQNEHLQMKQFQTRPQFFGAPEQMRLVMQNQPIPAEHHFLPEPLSSIAQPVQHGMYPKQQIVPVLIPVPIPVPVSMESMSTSSDEEQQLPYREGLRSEEDQEQEEERGVVLVYNESSNDERTEQNTQQLPPRSEEQPVIKPFPSQEVLQEMKMFRKLILDKLIPKPENNNNQIPSDESEVSPAESQSEIVEVFVPFPN